ncbi:MAG: Holliday junction resolvase RuvX [Gemmatimonadaceae bacterium]|nr:Holliday junction resolvase RuvX [Gemmatimonadaceae bacterium]
MGRLVGVDWGERRIGLAASDELRMIASPAGVITRRAGKRPPVAELLRRMAEIGDVDAVVMGMPLDGNGDETPRCAEVRDVARAITERSGRRVSFVDERYSTARTHRAVHEAGGKVGDHRHDMDALTAALLLQGVLNGGAVMPPDDAADQG